MNDIVPNRTLSTDNTRSTDPDKSPSPPNITSTTISPERKTGTPRQPSQAPGNSSSSTSTSTEPTSNAKNKGIRDIDTISPTDTDHPQEFLGLQKTFPTTPQYENDPDHTFLDSEPLSPFFRSSPKVTPSRYPVPRNTSFPPPKYTSGTMNLSSNELDDRTPIGQNTSISTRHTSGGVETILRASASTDFGEQPQNEDEQTGPSVGTHISPQRESHRNSKVSVVSPPEEDPRRAGSQITNPGGSSYDMPPNVPDSPYSHGPAYYQGHGPGQYPPSAYQYPPRSKISAHPATHEDPNDRYSIPPPYYPPPYGYGGYERGGYDMEGYGKRHRPSDEPVPREGDGEPSRYPPGPPGRHYFERSGHHPFYRPSVSESFDTGSDGGSKRSPRRPGPPPVSKAPSYPPPPSPTRYGAGADSSAASYPGARRTEAGSDYSYSNSAIYSHSPHPSAHGAPPPYTSGEPRYPPPRFDDPAGAPSGHPAHPPPPDYYRDPRAAGYPPGPPPGFYEGPGPEISDYYARSQAPPQEEHPLLRDEKAPISSPSRRSKNSSDQSHASNPSKDGSSPNKPRPSTTAQAAIAAGMTEPASAKEVNFDINDPPLQPIIPPSTRPICTQNSEVNVNDVLCGRGGGTNTQIGNRRFRALVQEFQPTYLLCRRKEKPLIARTIVLIVRNRGGRFLKKHEDEGTFFEVGDEKAEAKTSQALREGLDVRASRSSIDGKKKPVRARKKKSPKKSPDRRTMDEGAPIGESPRRDGPPLPPPPHHNHHDGYAAYPPPPPYGGYYGYDPYYPPAYGAGYGQSPYSSPSRTGKRQRVHPKQEVQYPEYPHYPPTSPFKSYSYGQYPEHYSSRGPPQEPGHDDDNPMWEVDFSPPRTIVKKQSGEH